MLNLIGKLFLDNKQFDDAIKKSKTQVNNLKSSGNGLDINFNTLIGTVGKFAAGLGIATGALESFDTWVHSTQEIGDKWDNTIGACKDTIETFFTALASGNWSAFQDGLASTLSGMYELRTLADTMSDAEKSYNLSSSMYQDEIMDKILFINDKRNSYEERKKAAEEADEISLKYMEETEQTAAGMMKYALERLNKKYPQKKGQEWTEEEVLTYSRWLNNGFLDSGEARAYHDYKDRKEAEAIATGEKFDWKTAVKNLTKNSVQTRQEQIAAKTPDDPRFEKMRTLENDSDISRDIMLGTIDRTRAMAKGAKMQRRRVVSVLNKFHHPDEEGGGKRDEEPLPDVGSLEDLYTHRAIIDKEIAKTDINSPRLTELIDEKLALEEVIKLAEERKKQLMEEARLKRMTPEERKIEEEKKAAEEEAKRKKKEEEEKRKKEAEDRKKAEEEARIKEEEKKAALERMREIEDGFRKMQKQAQAAADTVSSIGNIFSNIGGAVEGTTGEMLKFVGTMMQGIADVIPLIRKLMIAKKAESLGSGVSEASKMPFPLNIAAIASIISTIVGVFASFPKFASGGIVQGMKYGDMNLARVNGGEMILNNVQQQRLFNALNNGGAVGNNGIAIEREWTIRGADLVGTIKNYNKLQAKTGKKIF